MALPENTKPVLAHWRSNSNYTVGGWVIAVHTTEGWYEVTEFPETRHALIDESMYFIITWRHLPDNLIKDVRKGQIWRHKRKKSEYLIVGIGKMKDEELDVWYPSITYLDDEKDEMYTREYFAFLDKFERV